MRLVQSLRCRSCIEGFCEKKEESGSFTTSRCPASPRSRSSCSCTRSYRHRVERDYDIGSGHCNREEIGAVLGGVVGGVVGAKSSEENRTVAIILGTAHSQNGIQVTGVNLNAAQIAAAGFSYPTILTAPPAGTAANPNLFVFARDYVQPGLRPGGRPPGIPDYRAALVRDLTRPVSGD